MTSHNPDDVVGPDTLRACLRDHADPREALEALATHGLWPWPVGDPTVPRWWCDVCGFLRDHAERGERLQWWLGQCSRRAALVDFIGREYHTIDGANYDAAPVGSVSWNPNSSTLIARSSPRTYADGGRCVTVTLGDAPLSADAPSTIRAYQSPEPILVAEDLTWGFAPHAGEPLLQPPYFRLECLHCGDTGTLDAPRTRDAVSAVAAHGAFRLRAAEEIVTRLRGLTRSPCSYCDGREVASVGGDVCAYCWGVGVVTPLGPIVWHALSRKELRQYQRSIANSSYDQMGSLLAWTFASEECETSEPWADSCPYGNLAPDGRTNDVWASLDALRFECNVHLVAATRSYTTLAVEIPP